MMGLWQQTAGPAFGPTPTRGTTAVCGLLAAGVLVLLGAVWGAYNVPVHGGVDQNGYLVQGKILLETGTAGRTPADPFEFVGRMWIGADLGTDAERYFAKYPLGVPLLVAVGGGLFGPDAAYWISPVGMLLGVAATYLLLRPMVGPMLALVGMVLVGTGPATMGLAVNPNSHGAALGFATAGMALLLAWTRRWDRTRLSAETAQVSTPGRMAWLIAPLAGLCLGYAVLVRYTEALLVLPAALAVLFTMRARPTWWMQVGLIGLGWLVVVGAQVAFNLAAFGSYTGYDPTNESVGFALIYAFENWQNMLRQLDQTGLVLFFPVAVAGLVGLWWWHWRWAAVMTAWILPGIAVYTAYYWAPDNWRLSYIRFFLTLMPPLVACAMVAVAKVREAVAAAAPAPAARRPVAPDGWVLAATGVATALAVLLNVTAVVPQMMLEQTNRMTLLEQARQIAAHVPAGSVVWSDDESLIRQLQYTGDYRLYYTPLFNRRALDRLTTVDPNDPSGLQPQRAQQLAALLSSMGPRELMQVQREVTERALTEGRAVFIASQDRGPARNRWMGVTTDRLARDDQFTVTVVAAWGQPALADLDQAGMPWWQRAPRARGLQLPREQTGRLTQITLSDQRRADAASPADTATAPAAGPKTVN